MVIKMKLSHSVAFLEKLEPELRTTRELRLFRRLSVERQVRVAAKGRTVL